MKAQHIWCWYWL